MKDKHPIDKQFNEQLGSHTMQPDPKIWENISKEISSKSNQKPLLWLIPILLLLAGGVYYIFHSPSEALEVQSQAERNKILPSSSAKVIPQSTHPIQDSEDMAHQIDRINEHTLYNEPSPAHHSNHNQSSPPIVLQSQEKNRQNKKEETDMQPKNSSLHKIQHKPTLTKVKDIISTPIENPRSTNSEERPFVSNSIELPTATTITSGAANTLTPPYSPIEVRDKPENPKALRAKKVSLLPVQNVNHFLGEESFREIEIHRYMTRENTMKKTLDDLDICKTIYPKDKSCPTFGPLHRRFQVDAYALTGYNVQLLSSKAITGEWSGNLQQRQATEQGGWNIGMGVRFANQWTNGISLKGGLQINRGQIQLNYLDETNRRVIVNVTIDSIVHSNGDITIITDTISMNEIGVVERQEFNDFTTIDIPLTLGYSFLNRNYDIELNAGVMINALFRRSGRIFGPDDELISIDSDAPNAYPVYQDQIGISFIASMAYNHHLTDQFSVFIEPQIRYMPKSLSVDSYPLNESWFRVNLLLGGRYSF